MVDTALRKAVTAGAQQRMEVGLNSGGGLLRGSAGGAAWERLDREQALELGNMGKHLLGFCGTVMSDWQSQGRLQGRSVFTLLNQCRKNTCPHSL